MGGKVIMTIGGRKKVKGGALGIADLFTNFLALIGSGLRCSWNLLHDILDP